MPICEGCSGSYANEYSFCPYCGRAKAEPERIEVAIRSDPRRVEQAVMNIALQGKTLVTEYPFDWKKGVGWVIGQAFGAENVDKAWNEAGIYTLQLIAYHPEKGEQVAFNSPTFMAFLQKTNGNDREFPIEVRNKLLYQERSLPWLQGFFEQRKLAWKSFNDFLLRGGWQGISKEAITREPPFKIEPPLTYSDTKGGLRERAEQMNAGGSTGLWFDFNSKKHPTRKIEEIAKAYMYQREV